MDKYHYINETIAAPKLPKMQTVEAYLKNGGTITVLPARVKREVVVDEYGDRRKR